MVDECSSWVSITTNGYTLIYTICDSGKNVVELVRHTSRLGDVCNGTWAVELGGNNVVHHTTSVSDLEASWLDTTDSGWTNDGDVLLLGVVQDLTGTLNMRLAVTSMWLMGMCAYSLWYTLGDDGDGADLLKVHQLHCGAVDGTRRGKVDYDIDVGVLLHGLLDALVYWKKGFRCSPVPKARNQYMDLESPQLLKLTFC